MFCRSPLSLLVAPASPDRRHDRGAASRPPQAALVPRPRPPALAPLKTKRIRVEGSRPAFVCDRFPDTSLL